MNSDLKQLLNSIGALSEAAHLFYTNLRKRGFSRGQAMKLTQTFVAEILAGGK